MNRHESANGRHALNLPVVRRRPNVSAPAASVHPPALAFVFALVDRQKPIQESRAARRAHESTRPRTRRLVPHRRLSPGRDRRERTRQAPSPPARRNTRSSRRSPREPLSKLQTTPDDDSGAARPHRMGTALCAVLPRSRPAGPKLRARKMEAARSDERLRGSTAPAVVTEKTPEASLSREGSYGLVDSPGRLTRRAQRLRLSLRRSALQLRGSAGISPASPGESQ